MEKKVKMKYVTIIIVILSIVLGGFKGKDHRGL